MDLTPDSSRRWMKLEGNVSRMKVLLTIIGIILVDRAIPAGAWGLPLDFETVVRAAMATKPPKAKRRKTMKKITVRGTR
jgi:hypothetical protein